jgi:hypothetical protein
MDKNELPRIGTFFIMVGCGLFILFTCSILARETNILFLLVAAVALFLGFAFRRKAPHQESTRFSGIRKIRQSSRQRREEKHQRKPNKNDQTPPSL